jgi:hypothetical protein
MYAHSQPFPLRWGLADSLPGLDLNHERAGLSLLSSKDRRHESWVPDVSQNLLSCVSMEHKHYAIAGLCVCVCGVVVFYTLNTQNFVVLLLL